MPLSDSIRFFGAWLTAPLRVASLTPSGAGLSRLITSEISAATGPVLELGPGTGVFTQALLARGVAEQDLGLVELGEEFVPLLRRRFPAARVVRMDARRLAHSNPFDGSCFGAVISGLPLLSMPADVVTDILRGSFAFLKPGGAFYQFTYGPRCPIRRSVLDRLNLHPEWIGHTYRNIPPASVYRIVSGAVVA